MRGNDVDDSGVDRSPSAASARRERSLKRSVGDAVDGARSLKRSVGDALDWSADA